ncbi:MAG: hypothetical protein JJT75_02615 [Opitutales bacterium]|nr:hypothetical protein [Opitutales bacterium]
MAESRYAQGAEVWDRLFAEENPSEDSLRWQELSFRRADAHWRALAGTTQSDHTVFVPYIESLGNLTEVDEVTLWVAEAHRSLAEFHWLVRLRYHYRGHGPHRTHFQKAFTAYTRLEDTPEHRQGLLDLVMRLVDPASFLHEGSGNMGRYLGYLPWDRKQLRLVRRFAEEMDQQMILDLAILTDRIHARDFLQNLSSSEHQDVLRTFAGILAATTEEDRWFDYAVLLYGRFLENFGRWHEEFQYAKSNLAAAVELYRPIAENHTFEGKLPHYGEIKARFDELTLPSLSLQSPETIRPESLLRFHLQARNVEEVSYAIYALDGPATFARSENWIHLPDRNRGETTPAPVFLEENPVDQWTDAPEPDEPFASSTMTLRREALPRGGYWLRVTGQMGEETVVQEDAYFVVTDSTFILQDIIDGGVVFTCHMDSGEPAPGEVHYFTHRTYRNGGERIGSVEKVPPQSTDEDGLLTMDRTSRWEMIWAETDQGPVLYTSRASLPNFRDRNMTPHFTTDRSLYRPGESVHLRYTERVPSEDGLTPSPEGREVILQLLDARNQKFKTLELILDAYGVAETSFTLPEDMALGKVRVRHPYWRASSQTWSPPRIRSTSNLLRVEEFRTPEFRVDVTGPGSDGQPEAFSAGDEVEVEVKVEYYAGGAIPGAEVDYSIVRRPLHLGYTPNRSFAWLRSDARNHSRRYHRRENPVIEGKTTTGEDGIARIYLDTAEDLEGLEGRSSQVQDWEYVVRVNVTDASRRIIEASGSVRVTKHPYRWGLHTDGEVYRPGAEVELTIKALDPYDRPVETKGKVLIARQVAAEKVRKAPGAEDLTIIEEGYRWKPVTSGSFVTNEGGSATFAFTPTEAGLYRFLTIDESRGIQKEHTFLAATEETHSLSIERGNLRLYSERDTFRQGDTGRVVVVAPQRQNNTVLFTSFGDDLIDAKVLRMEGNVRIVDIPIGPGSVPNIHLRAAQMRDRTVQKAEVEWIIPPVELFLDVALDKLPESFRPGEEGEIGFTVRDHEGNPVQGNFAIGVTDKAIQAIQPRIEKDLQEFFYGEKNRLISRIGVPRLRGPAYLDLGKTTQVKRELQGELPVEEYWRERNSGEKIESLADKLTDDPVERLRTLRIGGVHLRGGGLSEIVRQLEASSEFHEAFPEFTLEVVNHFNIDGDIHLSLTNMTIERIIEYGIAEMGATFNIHFLPEKKTFQLFVIPYHFELYDRRRSGLQAPADPFAPDRSAPADPFASARSSFRSASTEVVLEESLSAPFGGADLGEAASVRTDFRSTAHWTSMVITDQEGRGTVSFTFPENLTEWEILVQGVTTGPEVGWHEAVVPTSVPVAMRVQTPRFLVEGDYAILSGIVQNLTDEDLGGGLNLEAEGLRADREGFEQHPLPQGAQVRIDRGFHAENPRDKVIVTGEVRSGGGSDAMEKSFPVVEYGIFQYHGDSTVLRLPEKGEADSTLSFELPPQRHPERASLDIRLSVSLASTALDALPYLIRFPYGCTEQTLSRFIPTVLVRRTLEDLELDPTLVENRVFGGVDEGNSEGPPGHYRRSLKELDSMVAMGVNRLLDMQHNNGAWGWWKDSLPNAWMTAYATMGLAVGAQAGIDVERSSIDRAQQWLRSQLIDYRDRPDLAVFMLYAIAVDPLAEWDERDAANAEYFWENRDVLRSYGRSLLTLTFHHRQDDYPEYLDRANRLLVTLENGLREVRTGSELLGEERGEVWAVHWGEEGPTLRWNRNGVESTSWALRAYLAVRPDSPRAEQAMRWLVQQRRGAQWSNTRDSAIALMALTDYLRIKEEGQSDLEVDVLVNGEKQETFLFGGEKALGHQTLQLPGDSLSFGQNEVTFQVRGQGSLYASIGAEYFTREDPLEAQGNQVYVTRKYRRETSVPRLDGGRITKWTDLESGDRVHAGDRIEVRLLIEVPVDLEYLVFEDKKPAGLEPEQQRSGELNYAVARRADGTFTGRRTFTHMELREQHTAFFIDHLRDGVHEIRYRLRAETPGHFTALPVLGHAMYVPEVRANSSSFRLRIEDQR